MRWIIADNPLDRPKCPHSSHATPRTCSNRMKPLWNVLYFQRAAFSPDRRQFYSMPDPWKFIPKFLDNSLLDLLILCEHRGGYWSYKFSRMILIKTSQCQEFRLQVKLVRMSLCCYGNCVNLTQIITNFHLLLIQLWWPFTTVFHYFCWWRCGEIGIAS